MIRSLRTIHPRIQPVLLCAAVLFAAAPAWGQPNDVVMVEEHWELRLGQPDADRSAPQTTMVMSPTGNLDGVHFLFTLNHAAVPDYQAGGVQIQAWDGGELVGYDDDDEVGSLSHSEEVVTWVQKMWLNDGSLKFRIVDGHSETWNQFGNEDMLLSVPTAITRLNDYRPAVSLTESQVSYAENRVISLTLTKLRWMTSDGTVHEQNAPIPLDTSLDQ
jgi:hypothetical protein